MGLLTVVTANSQISTWWYATTSSSSHWAQLTQTGVSWCVKVTTDGSREATDNDPHTWIKLKWRPCSSDPILNLFSIQVTRIVLVKGLTENAFSNLRFCCHPCSIAKRIFFFQVGSQLTALRASCLRRRQRLSECKHRFGSRIRWIQAKKKKRKWNWASKPVV